MNSSDLIAGVDEVGCGPLAGPVVAAAVILDPQRAIQGLADSKRLSEDVREQLAPRIRECNLAWAIGRAEVWEIDQFNIRQASLLAMTRAIAALGVRPERVLVDGNQSPNVPYPVTAIPGGDDQVPCISAASILAKVARDAEMVAWHGLYPNYRFDSHKGYSTAVHREALNRYGPCPLHRHSFSPVRRCLDAVPWSSLYGQQTIMLSGESS